MSRHFRTTALLALALPAVLGALERHLGAPVYDGEAETTYRQVSWYDFKGRGQAPPDWNRWSGGSYAHIASGLRLGGYDVETREENGGWTAVAVGIRPYAVMDKFRSAVRPGSRKPGVLAHEQLHFDISEMIARRLTVELADLEGHGASEAEARDDLRERILRRFEEAGTELTELQEQYDRETKHRNSRKQQEKWAERVDEGLRQATTALVELLDE